ncbi:hypothetical protein DSUL_140058 [Desulfovibrionales bacterium]
MIKSQKFCAVSLILVYFGEYVVADLIEFNAQSGLRELVGLVVSMTYPLLD